MCISFLSLLSEWLMPNRQSSLFEPLVGVADAEPTILSFLSLLSEWLMPNRQSSLF